MCALYCFTELSNTTQHNEDVKSENVKIIIFWIQKCLLGIAITQPYQLQNRY